jgi:hypothetical protein
MTSDTCLQLIAVQICNGTQLMTINVENASRVYTIVYGQSVVLLCTELTCALCNAASRMDCSSDTSSAHRLQHNHQIALNSLNGKHKYTNSHVLLEGLE